MAQFPEFVVVFPESIEIDKGLYAVGVGVGAGVVGAGVVGAGVVGAGVVGAGVVDIGPEVATEVFVWLFTMSSIRLLNKSNSVLKLFLFKRVPNGKSKICFKKLLILVPVIVVSSWNISRILVIKSSMLTF
jgi:hypothetical protein